jgi:hypothetical protein
MACFRSANARKRLARTRLRDEASREIAAGWALLMRVPTSVASLARGVWRKEGGQRWLVPLALCVTGLILLFAFSAEALAPFIYAIF